MQQATSPVMISKEEPGFVLTPAIEKIVHRAMLYASAGLPIHLTGPTGTGKTSIAMHVAARLGRPVVVVHGDEEFGTSDFVGTYSGYSRRSLKDNFIHSVKKNEEQLRKIWTDNRLTVACKQGYTFLYDEFTRSRPEANNVLLSVLEERTLDISKQQTSEGYVKVHPAFAAIFTSNPIEYAGAHKSQDALRDRMVTLRLGTYDRASEVAIVEAKGGVAHNDAERIVDVVRTVREANPRNHGHIPSIRAGIRIAMVTNMYGGTVSTSDGDFVQACVDIMDSEQSDADHGTLKDLIVAAVKEHCGAGRTGSKTKNKSKSQA